jgi:hypothetical protein
MMLAMCGAYFAYRSLKQSRPHPVWVPMPINPDLTGERRDELAKNLKQKLTAASIMTEVCNDLNLATQWGLPSTEAAANELSQRIFVTPGEAHGSVGMVPSINVGVTGKEKEKVLSNQIAMRLMEDVWKIVGIDPPTRQKR